MIWPCRNAPVKGVSVLSVCGGAYQGVFRNPLADPYLLGVAAGAGLGATLAIVAGGSLGLAVPAAAFLGAILAVTVAYVLGGTGGGPLPRPG